MSTKKDLRRQQDGFARFMQFSNDLFIEQMVYGESGKPRGIIRRPDGSDLFLPKPKEAA